jgi:2-hydroxychromene-2-carboxylate isomerase
MSGEQTERMNRRETNGLDLGPSQPEFVLDIGSPSTMVSNSELKRLIDKHNRRLARLEEKVDQLLVETGAEPRPVGEVLQDVLDDELTQCEATEELGWCQARVSQVVNEIHAAGESDE